MVGQINWIGNFSINKHIFTSKSDSISLALDVKINDVLDLDSINNYLGCKITFKSSKYIFNKEGTQDILEFDMNFSKRLIENTYRFTTTIPIALFNNKRYWMSIKISENKWQDYLTNENFNLQLAPISVGEVGFVQGFSKLSINNLALNFAFLDFENNFDISSNKLEGIYSHGFCSDELISFSDFNFHIWKTKSIDNLIFNAFYSIDDEAENKLSDMFISDISNNQSFNFNNKNYNYSFYNDENINDVSISLNNKIIDLIQGLYLDNENNIDHQINFRFEVIADNNVYSFPETGNLSYNIKVSNSPTGADCQAALLPIDLLKWEAVKRDKTVNFEWITASELNNDYFELQKSSDSKLWKAIYKINGNGTSNSYNNYTALDNYPFPGQNYYRLRQTDYDGNFKYSKVKSIFIIDNKLSLYPNPAKDYIYYKIADYNKEFNVEIYNTQGKLVKSFILPLKNQAEDRIDISNLKDGTYFIKYINLTNHQVKVEKFIKF